jgi:hypothetical protein
MDLSIEGIQRLLQVSTYVITGWVISWLVFLLALPIMMRVFGKVRGAALNYGMSWLIMVAVILVLELVRAKKDGPIDGV